MLAGTTGATTSGDLRRLGSKASYVMRWPPGAPRLYFPYGVHARSRGACCCEERSESEKQSAPRRSQSTVVYSGDLLDVYWRVVVWASVYVLLPLHDTA